jgi:N-carbamoylputrescine amidase
MAKRVITVAAIQSAFGPDLQANIAKIEGFVREAGKRGAQLVLAPELFQSIYFPTKQDPKWFETAKPVAEHPSVLALQKLAKELNIVIPISFFEKDGPRYYNSVAIADAGGEILGVYRKSHIPAARAMMLQGAEILLYPTAIGSEPYDLSLDTHARWQRAMQGHAVANAVPVVAANRIGVEQNDGATQSYYGHSFIADHTGELAASFGDKEEGVLIQSFDLAETERYRAEWGFFRDRRTDLYAKSIV